MPEERRVLPQHAAVLRLFPREIIHTLDAGSFPRRSYRNGVQGRQSTFKGAGAASRHKLDHRATDASAIRGNRPFIIR